MKKILLLCLLVCFACKNESETTKLTADASDVKIVKTSEGAIEVYDFKAIEPFFNKDDDKTYVINFWATWCKPCIKELPYFESLNANYKDKNVEVLLVSLDFPQQYEKQLIPYIKDNKLQSRVLVLDDPDMNAWIGKVSEDWSGAIPATLIYNKEKRIFYEQSFNYEELETEIKQFLK